MVGLLLEHEKVCKKRFNPHASNDNLASRKPRSRSARQSPIIQKITLMLMSPSQHKHSRIAGNP